VDIRLVLQGQLTCRPGLKLVTAAVLIGRSDYSCRVPVSETIPILRIRAMQSGRRGCRASCETAHRPEHLTILFAIYCSRTEEEESEKTGRDWWNEVDDIANGATKSVVWTGLSDTVLNLVISADTEIDEKHFEGTGSVSW